MPSTTTRGFRYPVLATDAPNIPQDIQNLAEDVDAQFIRGNLVDRPAFGKVGRRFYANDTGHEYLDLGTAWVEVTPTIPNTSVGTAQLQDGAVTSAKIADGTIVSADLAAAAGITKGQLAAAVQEAVFAPGDLKYTTRTAAPAGWLMAQGQMNLSKATYADLWAVAQAEIALGNPLYVDVNATDFGIIDCQGRLLVSKGTHADVNALGKSDGLAVGSRKIKHRHGRGSLSASSSTQGGGSHGHTTPFTRAGLAGGGIVCLVRWVEGSGANGDGGNWGNNGAGDHNHGVSTSLSGEIGDTTGPLDQPANIVVNVMIKT